MFVFQQREYPNHLSSLWKADLFQEMRLQLLNEVAKMLAERERCENIDVQVPYKVFVSLLEKTQPTKDLEGRVCLKQSSWRVLGRQTVSTSSVTKSKKMAEKRVDLGACKGGGVMSVERDYQRRGT